MLSELSLKTRLVERTDNSAAKQSIEKVGLLHVKHMSMRTLFLKDLQKEGHIEIEKVLGTGNPADLFTKPLIPLQFVSCRARIPGIYWGESDSNRYRCSSSRTMK